ncbi:hypothetical protein Ocin01_07377, partial [Orchesella cincta]
LDILRDNCKPRADSHLSPNSILLNDPCPHTTNGSMNRIKKNAVWDRSENVQRERSVSAHSAYTLCGHHAVELRASGNLSTLKGFPLPLLSVMRAKWRKKRMRRLKRKRRKMRARSK